jgi:hypothetical protein
MKKCILSRPTFFLLLFLRCIDAFSAPNSSGTPQRRRTTTTSGERRRSSSSRSRGEDESQSSGPKSESTRSQRQPRRPASRQQQQVFDPKKITSEQKPNENANALDMYVPSYQSDPSFIRRRSSSSVVHISPNADVIVSEDDASCDSDVDSEQCKGPEINHAHFEQLSLDDLFPGLDFSKQFFINGEFRQAIRVATRKDIFFTTPAYADLSPKVAAMMLDDDSSLQGTWNCIPKSVPEELKESLPLRMARLTKVLKETLGPDAPTGDDFMMALGNLCGQKPSAHWIDIIGVKDRIVSHSWHQDTGGSYEGQSELESSRYTVMLGFPIENQYCGCGVFSHAIKLKHEHLAPDGHNDNEPVLFQGTADEEFIIRPEFLPGREILRYRDVDVLHSAPDTVYRQSVMRFM